MALNYEPKRGAVLMCEYGPNPHNITAPGVMNGPLAVSPEMYKLRHVMVISAPSSRLVAVVPFSTDPPLYPKNHHHKIPRGKYPFFIPGTDIWLKGDMVASVSTVRLSRCLVGGKPGNCYLDDFDKAKVLECVKQALRL
jgi:uncharacterized protein YifN (PemK superfamily)